VIFAELKTLTNSGIIMVSVLQKSPEFSAWWPRHDVVQQSSTVKRIQHPSDGLLEFEYMNLDVSECPGMQFVVCTPRKTGGY